MLIISDGKRKERVIDLSPESSAFVSCATTLANALIGVRPHVPEACGRTERVQLLADGVYASGIGVSREIVSLPAPRVLRLYDVETGEPARREDGTTATVTLSLDGANVTSIERLQVGGCTFELMVRLFIDTPGKPEVATVINLRQMNSDNTSSRRLRLDYGIDTCAANEYLGTSPWLTARHYEIEGAKCSDDCFSVVVATAEDRLRYEVRIERSPSSASLATTWARCGRDCVISTTFNFRSSLCHELFVHWLVRTESDASKSRMPEMLFKCAVAEREHRARWAKLWEDHNVEINADGELVELGMRYAIFQLLQHGIESHFHSDGFISPARGLTSTYHSGAVFFDTELHKCIFWIWNDPRVARAIIDYRYHRIERALEFAKSTGFSGARFPEASNDRGTENGPRYVLSCPGAEMAREWSVDEVLHVSADICWALRRYWTVTGDDAYMGSCGARIVAECAKFSASAFTWSDERCGYVIERVMGPDEYHYHVSNNFYTNYLLGWCLRFALSLVECGLICDVCNSEIQRWRSISNNVYLPWMSVDGILIPEEFDGYAGLSDAERRLARTDGPQFLNEDERNSSKELKNFTSKIVKQADIILLMTLFPDDFTDEVKKAAFKFYEPRTVHESSLSYGPHAVLAADIGDASDCAYFISRASRYNLDFTPAEDYRNGLHLSAYAGAWQGLVEGLAGLRVDGGTLYFRPRLPGNWNSYRFTIWFRGHRLQVTVPADGVVYIDCEGNRLPVKRLADVYACSCGELE
ncbi:glycosyl hydrolase family 65 protein [Trinickia acidisoli]|uniref:glycosyl hydrolase family 65 protein n=1 Tax=Trinickia acidisoli TaxID=2767482 RepID=UPI001F5C9D0B|nr:glycosyl hydrolase family 65 protein [Trinickia acidisoli]